MRRLVWLLAVVPVTASADDRLDPGSIPDLSLIELVYPLDRFVERQFKMCGNEATTDRVASAAIGTGSVDHEITPVASTMVAASSASNLVVAALRSELVATPDQLLRGRHRAFADLLPGGDTGPQLSATLQLDHGRALGLAPVHLGPGPRIDGGIGTRALIPLSGRSGKNGAWSLAVRGDAGVTAWSDAPALDSANRRSIGIGGGRMPVDGELPRGDVELLRGRIERVRIDRAIAAAGTPTLGSEVRIAEVGVGTDDLTLHIDHELLAVVAIDVGWSWLEADTAGGTLSDRAFRARLAGAFRWRTDRVTARSVGIAIARLPDYTPDGQRLVTDTRTELTAGIEAGDVEFAARGGISWVRARAGAPVDRLLRYGSQFELFLDLGHSLQLGGYHATWFEPPTVDPWAAPRRWTTETGVALRLRAKPYERRAPARGAGE